MADASRPGSAVVLAGGTGRRLGGVDKAGLVVDGETLLARALRATAGIGEVVVVGPASPLTDGLRTVREEPPHGGPAAGLLAGVRALGDAAGTVLVLAVDMPGVTAGTVDRLTRALAEAGPGVDGATLHDGRRQPLCAVYRLPALLAAAPAEPAGTSVRSLLAGLRLVDVPAAPGEARDVDTWHDLDPR